jgi:hypothetical protein
MVIDYLWKKKGFTSLNALLERLKSGAKMDEALKRTYGVDLDGLWAQWKKEMLTRGFKTHPGLVQTSLKFKRPGQAESAEDEMKASDHGIDTIKDKKAKDFAHLGELLRAKGRHTAAVKEYTKATALGGDGNPLVQNGAASSLLTLGRPAEVPLPAAAGEVLLPHVSLDLHEPGRGRPEARPRPRGHRRLRRGPRHQPVPSPRPRGARAALHRRGQYSRPPSARRQPS